MKNRYSYDAWGRPRDPGTWVLKKIDVANALVDFNAWQPRFDRGYTGHEQMAGFGLINANGRLYDAYSQRFLSPDDDMQDPSNVQNLNRYSYALNNPLRYNDPSVTQMTQMEMMVVMREEMKVMIREKVILLARTANPQILQTLI
jgi:RHS repeat-associated protein